MIWNVKADKEKTEQEVGKKLEVEVKEREEQRSLLGEEKGVENGVTARN